MDDLQEVLTMLRKLLEQARDCEADTGNTPAADEALTWAISEVEAMISRRDRTSQPSASAF